MKPKKVILAFDSFKGSMSAAQAVQAASGSLKRVLGSTNVVELPMADGGEGTSEAIGRFMDARPVCVSVHDALMRPIQASFLISRDGDTAIMEMAAAAGLTLLSPDERDPLLTTTFGVGEMIREAIATGCRRIILGIGGSATNDGGTGMLAAIGYEFLDKDGNSLSPCGANLSRIATMSRADAPNADIDVICDVDNPLFGPNGAAYVFAAQKGADAEQIEKLDMGLRVFADVCGLDPNVPGSGAAGGLGYGLRLCGAALRPGSDAMIEFSGLEEHLWDADLVLTGEGKIDGQTLCGKLPFGLMKCASKYGVPVIALAGRVEDRDLLVAAGFRDVIQISPAGMPLSIAMSTEVAMENLSKAIETVIQGLNNVHI